MKRALILGVLAITLAATAGVAMAQREQPARVEDGRFRPEWERLPSNFSRYYPQAAQDAEIPGMATLCCVPRDDRSLECRVAEEFPEGMGFGEATLRTASELRMSLASYEAYQADPGNWMQFTTRWVLPGSAGGQNIVNRPETPGLCRPQNGNGPPNPIR